MPKVSVIIPTYNRSHCIERALKSAQNQTFEDIEILVCDDASTDATQDIVRANQARDPRVQLLSLSDNKGAGAARNLGMESARGEYIAFLDSDDEWLPEKLVRQVEQMDAEPTEVGVCLCGASIVKNGNIAQPVAYIPKKKWEHDTLRQFVTGQMAFLTPTILFRRCCLLKSGLMEPEMRRNQDREFLLRLFAHYDLSVISESYATIHLTVSLNNRHYDALKIALPYHLQHTKMIQQKLGFLYAKNYNCFQRTNIIHAAVRERRIAEAIHALYYRLLELPILLPKEVLKISKAFLVGVIGPK